MSKLLQNSDSDDELDSEETIIKLLELANDWDKMYANIFKNIIKMILDDDNNDKIDYSDTIKKVKLFIHETNINIYDSPTYMDRVLNIIRKSYVPIDAICTIIAEHAKLLSTHCEKIKSIIKMLKSDDADSDKIQKVLDALL